MATNDDAAVLVVGAGPVGLLLGCELARREVPVRVIDKLPAPTTESRAILVHSRSLEMLERVGVFDELVASGVRTNAMEMFDAGRLLVRLSLNGVDSPFPYSITTAQTETERVLADRLRGLGVEVERGVELVSFEQDAAGVDYTLRGLDGRETTSRCDWIVGTDGAHSTVRKAMGSSLVGSFKGQRFLLGDVDADYDCARDSMQTFFSSDEGPLLVFPMVGERLRLIAEITDEPAAGPDHPEDTTIERLQSIADRRAKGMTLTSARWITVFEVHHAQVPAYRAGRTFLAGDAAHVHSPAGGQGMNTGMQDAFNLGWKLAAAVRQAPGADQLLDSYHAERHPIAARVLRDSTRLTDLGTVHGALKQKLRNSALRIGGGLAPIQHKLAAETSETDLSYRDSPIVAGHRTGRLHPGDVAPDVPGSPLRRELAARSGHVVLHFAAAAPATRVAGVGNVLVQAAAPAAGVGDAGSRPEGFDLVIRDDTGAIAGRYRARPGDVVVIRPDGYVGFIGRSDEGVDGVAALDRYLRGVTGAPAEALV